MFRPRVRRCGSALVVGVARRTFAAAVATLEPIDASAGVDQLLLAGVEGMALAAQFAAQLILGGAGGERVATRALDRGQLVLGVDSSLHGVLDFFLDSGDEVPPP